MPNPLTLTNLALVALGGAAGSVARFALSWSLQQWASQMAPATRFPWGTATVNILGCLLMGIFAGWAMRHDGLSQSMRLLLMTGLLGGFTTFSAFGLETFELLNSHQFATALAYVFSSLFLGVLAVTLGIWLSAGQTFTPH